MHIFKKSKIEQKWKHRKNCENHGFWLPKTFPKSIQNASKIDVSKNMRFFMDFCWFLVACCKSRASNFMRPRSVLLAFHRNQVFAFGIRFRSKNLSKTLPKRGPNPSKIDAKNVLFFNIHFFGFRPRFGRVLGLQVEAKFAILAPQKFWTRTCWALLNQRPLKNNVLGGSRLDFGSPRPDFWGAEARFGRVLERFFWDLWPQCQESQERPERLPKQDLEHKCAKSGWAAVLPPRGVSIGTKLGHFGPKKLRCQAFLPS